MSCYPAADRISTESGTISSLRFLYDLLLTLNLPKLAKGVKPGINRNEVYEIRASIPSQHTITVFGFGINLGPMKYIGQIVVALLFLYYYLHLSYVEMKKPVKEVIAYFPWISLYKGKLPIRITLIISIITISSVIWMGVLTNKILVNLRN